MSVPWMAPTLSKAPLSRVANLTSGRDTFSNLFTLFANEFLLRGMVIYFPKILFFIIII